MELFVHRRWFYEQYTGGDLYLDGRFFCNTLEDRVRDPGEKVPGQTAIPAGKYHVALTMSRRFGKVMPEIQDVKGFAGIRIHAGNTAADTSGCILVGIAQRLGETQAFLTQSQATFGLLMAKLIAAEKRGEDINITIQ